MRKSRFSEGHIVGILNEQRIFELGDAPHRGSLEPGRPSGTAPERARLPNPGRVRAGRGHGSGGAGNGRRTLIVCGANRGGGSAHEPERGTGGESRIKRYPQDWTKYHTS